MSRKARQDYCRSKLPISSEGYRAILFGIQLEIAAFDLKTLFFEAIHETAGFALNCSRHLVLQI